MDDKPTAPLNVALGFVEAGLQNREDVHNGLAGLEDVRLHIDRLTAERDDLAGKLAAAQAELHDLRIRAGLGEFDPDEPVIINCPQCGAEHVDMDGFGVIYCEACKYCVHPQTDGGVCGICGQEAD